MFSVGSASRSSQNIAAVTEAKIVKNNNESHDFVTDIDKGLEFVQMLTKV